VKARAKAPRMSKEERFEEILNGAAQVIARRGYRGSSIQDIAAELKVTPAALYHYVDSKQDLLAEICRRAGDRLHEAAKEIMRRDDLSSEEKLRELFRQHLRFLHSDRPIFGILIQERSELPEDRRHEFLEGERAYLATVRELLEQADATNFDVKDSRLAALAMLGMLNWVVRWYREGGAYDIEEVSEEFYRIFTQGVLARDSTPTPA
jgi:AcrR family transcriptional regulator